MFRAAPHNLAQGAPEFGSVSSAVLGFELTILDHQQVVVDRLPLTFFVQRAQIKLDPFAYLDRIPIKALHLCDGGPLSTVDLVSNESDQILLLRPGPFSEVGDKLDVLLPQLNGRTVAKVVPRQFVPINLLMWSALSYLHQ